MFTGLIETTGSIVSVEQRAGSQRIAIDAPGLASKLHVGDSIAVSGVCLTALDIAPPLFHADLAAETVARTSLTALAPGSAVNLELPTPAGTPLGGHVVQGHVDGTGTLLSLAQIDAGANSEVADWWLRIAVPEGISRYVVEKGSIAIEGISLTVARFDRGTQEGDIVSVAIIPHTYASTNLHTLKAGQPVNLEADVLIKFAEERLQRQQQNADDITLEFLVANGY
ncbi:Riboflavin synthase eubacterial/eukaryotic [Acidisarcina polymorpha]|uniref:Riboflavin synthase n=1 Tax=Acidisarcina polymorpha TaxID=2211140 RepID=A0A2Z5G4P1_9BACT|nr:riboflavin synthase [Acidisarcina polymorpha]AXC13707.1 Riboflavin synthase eubacterial/eukaryotic [Acidisarcina polymorpha]